MSSALDNSLTSCACGCRTQMSGRDSRGRPVRWIKGHNRIGTKMSTAKVGEQKRYGSGYAILYMPGHHRAHNDYVYEHVIIAERALGKPLLAAHPVHHHDTLKANNVNSNLVICEDAAYHQLLHRRARVARAGGNPDTEKLCSRCGLRELSAFGSNKSSHDGLRVMCRSCDTKWRSLNGGKETEE